MKQGMFITFEGPDGSGKTTQIKRLKAFLEQNGIQVVLTREPGGTLIGEKIREIILDKDHIEMDNLTEALLYAASRAQHVAQVIRPNLDAGRTVICDRFMDSSLVYQGVGRQLGSLVRTINEIAVNGTLPDLTFLLKVDPGLAKSRIKPGDEDRLEREALDYHQRVFQGYLDLERQEPARILGIDAQRSIEEISGEICQRVYQFLHQDQEA